MAISDNVARHIMEMLLATDGIAEIQRNELAQTFGCVPSQINYVITSRFTPEQGYLVESRRGGGGYIKITRRVISKDDMIMHIINNVGVSLNTQMAGELIKTLGIKGVITEEQSKIIAVAISDKSLGAVPREVRDTVRSTIFKNILLVIN